MTATPGSMEERAFLAVDAGNSKTVALVVDASGVVRGRGRGGCGDIYGATTAEAAVDAVFGAIDAALRQAAIGPGDIEWAALRMAGVDYDEDAEFWDLLFSERFGAPRRWTIKNDAFASLRLLDGSGAGISITVGTGPAVAARSSTGREEFSGMFVFDDLGGAGLGRSALEASCRAWMGMGPATALTEAMCTMFSVPDVWELRHTFTKRFGATPQSDLWKASRVVLAAADQGDEVAVRIVLDQARAFVGYAQWCARRVGVDLESGALPILLNGSVVTSEHSAMRDALRTEIARVAPAATVTVATASPLSGVVLDALAEGGCDLNSEILARVRHEHPDEFLAT